MNHHLMKWIVDLEDLIIQIFKLSSIPRITKELEQKLHEPILMYSNCGRFFNSKSPEKNLKLPSPN